jgi:hypothetical protein
VKRISESRRSGIPGSVSTCWAALLMFLNGIVRIRSASSLGQYRIPLSPIAIQMIPPIWCSHSRFPSRPSARQHIHKSCHDTVSTLHWKSMHGVFPAKTTTRGLFDIQHSYLSTLSSLETPPNRRISFYHIRQF